MITPTKLQTTTCHCGCGIIFLEIDAIFDDNDNAYVSIDHLAEDAMTEYLDRYSYEDLHNV